MTSLRIRVLRAGENQRIRCAVISPDKRSVEVYWVDTDTENKGSTIIQLGENDKDIIDIRYTDSRITLVLLCGTTAESRQFTRVESTINC
jgi:hypothetical protein